MVVFSNNSSTVSNCAVRDTRIFRPSVRLLLIENTNEKHYFDVKIEDGGWSPADFAPDDVINESKYVARSFSLILPRILYREYSLFELMT